MKRPIWLLVGVVVAVLIAWFLLGRGGGERVSVSLIDQFATAKDKRPAPDTFSLVDATINGDTKRAILVKQTSRIVYTVTVPENGEFKVSLGLLPEAWTIAGDGVLFRVLLGAGAPPEEILNIQLNPYANPGDRVWRDVSLDLAEYAGETVDLFLNTNNSPPSRPQRDDPTGDLAVWGAPRLVSR
jgi:hypothetical protein